MTTILDRLSWRRSMLGNLACIPLLALTIGCTTRFPAYFQPVGVAGPQLLIKSAGHFTLDAQCPAGMQLLGGGYVLPESPATAPYTISVPEYFPLNDNTWRVTVDVAGQSFNSDTSDTVFPVAYCLSANYPVGVQRVSDSTNRGAPRAPTLTAVCPPGAVALAGGYQTSASSSLASSYNDNITALGPAVDTSGQVIGWTVQFSYDLNEPVPPSSTAYVLCATKNLSPDIIGHGLPDPTNPALLFEWELAAQCDASSFTVGGGYELQGDPRIPHFVFANLSQNDFRNWRVLTLAIKPVNAMAYCVRIPLAPPR